MDDMVTWLRGQLDEDERVAQAQVDAGLWSDTEPQPPRWLAEVDAKRRIIDARDEAARHAQADFDHVLEGNTDAMNYCVKCIALPYAGRAGYREEWRP
jgi:hypothetical protein